MKGCQRMSSIFFFFNDTATTEIYTLSLHDALPISLPRRVERHRAHQHAAVHVGVQLVAVAQVVLRSEEHTSELQSRLHIVCRLLLEKKKKKRVRSAARARPDRTLYSVPRTTVTTQR